MKLVTAHLPVHFRVMTGQHFDKNVGNISVQSSIGKFRMIYFLLIISPYTVFGYSAGYPVAADIDNTDGLNFDIEDW